MASMTMTASFLGGSAVALTKCPATNRRGAFTVKASSKEVETVMVNKKLHAENNSGRRELFFAAVAAAACSVAKAAMADDEPKRGSPEAKKKYGPVCVTMPTARICRN